MLRPQLAASVKMMADEAAWRIDETIIFIPVNHWNRFDTLQNNLNRTVKDDSPYGRLESDHVPAHGG